MSNKADLVFIFADLAQKYAANCAVKTLQKYDCSLWSKFGKANGFAYMHTGMFDYMTNDTALVTAKKGSGTADLVNPAMQEFMKTQEYCDICKKWKLSFECHANEFCPPSNAPKTMRDTATADLSYREACMNGYCGCSA